VSLGPLSGIVTAASIGATGAPVGEAFTFSPDTHQIVAILPIGKIGHSEKLGSLRVPRRV
jgi:hypothetical protein